jgi:hypothetical protein
MIGVRLWVMVTAVNSSNFSTTGACPVAQADKIAVTAKTIAIDKDGIRSCIAATRMPDNPTI